MNKVVVIMLCFLMLSVFSCAENKNLEIKGELKTIETYGLFNDEIKDECVIYNIPMINVVVGAILIETIVVPVIIFGYSLFEPISVKENCKTKEGK